MSSARTRSISTETFTGEKGKVGIDEPADTRPNHANARHDARDLARGFNLNPFIKIKTGETITLADLQGPMWCSISG